MGPAAEHSLMCSKYDPTTRHMVRQYCFGTIWCIGKRIINRSDAATGHDIDGVLGVQNHRHGELGSVWNQGVMQILHVDILMLHCRMDS